MYNFGDIHVGRYIYLKCASVTSDTIGDERESQTNGIPYSEKCTLGNAVKGGGNWEVNVSLSIPPHNDLQGLNVDGYQHLPKGSAVSTSAVWNEATQLWEAGVASGGGDRYAELQYLKNY